MAQARAGGGGVGGGVGGDGGGASWGCGGGGGGGDGISLAKKAGFTRTDHIDTSACDLSKLAKKITHRCVCVRATHAHLQHDKIESQHGKNT